MAETLVNKTQAGEGIWTADNLVAGSGISIQQVPQPVIDENTLGVWHFDGNNDNAISGSSLQLGSSSYYGFSTEIYKFGSASGTIEQPSSKNRTTTILEHTNFTQGATYTLDFWVRTLGASLIGYNISRNFFVNYSSVSIYIRVFADKIRIQGANIETSVSPDTWHHIAVVVSSSEWKFFVDGILLYTWTQSGRLYFALTQETGSGISYLDELRVSNVARWTSDFTPYTVPYSASAGHAQYQINNTKADPDLSSYLQNTATGANALTILGNPSSVSQSTNIGKGSNARAGAFTSAYGYSADAASANSLAVGSYAQATGANSTAIGGSGTGTGRTSASGQFSVAIGSGAKVTGDNSAQIGTGTNSTANTFQVFGTRVVDANGKIPAANLDTAIPDVSTKADTDLSNVTNTGKSTGAGWAMPAMDANNWISLTLGASGTTYTMPEDGLVCFDTEGGAVGGHISLTCGYCSSLSFASQTYEVLRASIFIPKGYRFVLGYENAGALQAFGYYKLIGNAN